MVIFKIDGRMKVKTLKELFKEEFGGTLRVYNGNKSADDEATLATIRCNEDAKGGNFSYRANRTVGSFCKDILNAFGIKVKVATADNWIIVLDNLTLSTLNIIPKQAKISDMEKLLAKKDDNGKTSDKAKKKYYCCPVKRQTV